MSSTSTLPNSRCSLCGEAFDCGFRGDTPCWCAALPSLPATALESGASCRCPSCLRRELRAASLRSAA
ncbi:MAG: cysteine-rich CWC family protein [Burkholderiaceae bacterium]